MAESKLLTGLYPEGIPEGVEIPAGLP